MEHSKTDKTFVVTVRGRMNPATTTDANKEDEIKASLIHIFEVDDIKIEWRKDSAASI